MVLQKLVDNKVKNYQLLLVVTSISTDLYTLSTTIFSILQSHPSRGGYYFPVSGKVFNICYNVVTNVGSYRATGIIGLVKNGVTMPESENTILQLPQKGMKTYTAPIAFAAGDVLASYIRNASFQIPAEQGPAVYSFFVHALVNFDYN